MKRACDVPGTPTYFFYNLGCPKNLVDAEVAAARLEDAGWRRSRDPRDADLLVVTTCAFITAAEEESIEQVLEVAAAKDEAQLLAVVGCLVSREGRRLERLLPEVDIFLDVASMDRLPEAAGEISGRPPVFGPGGAGRRALFTPSHIAYLKIAEGCSNRCSYCTIPSIRGPLTSRPQAGIAVEAGALAAAGVRELVLVAQDTTSWRRDHGEDGALYPLMDTLSAIEGIEWIRLMYLHPARVDPGRLAAAIRRTKLLPYLDIPIQHVSDRVLGRMGRGYRGAAIERLVGELRSAVDGLVLRTTVMTGFPGETEDDFRTLVDFIERSRIDHVGIFRWSPERGTPAARLRGRPSEETTRRRLEELSSLQIDLAEELLAGMRGRSMEVMIDRLVGPDESPAEGFRAEGRWYGQAPDIDGVTWVRGTAPGPGVRVVARVEGSEALDLFAVTG
ncbi:MAG: 30S ribosomal protein S12 methylthiotransferase RimO [Candidatus Krumholzibacteria bacterium]|nr:30S ribosomal protein S12 methylthiotransferase RimO [Candidatus Krumholzibacteria bacterium]